MICLNAAKSAESSMLCSRKEAIEQGRTIFFTGLPCNKGHIAPKRVDSYQCLQCASERAAERYRKNPDKVKATSLRWQKENAEKANAANRRCSEKYKDRRDAYRKKYFSDPATKERRAAYMLLWREENKALFVSYVRKRELLKKQAMPKWLTNEHLATMRNFYLEAKRKELKEGKKFHVDHIVPLNGKDVCGLHVPWNLQILEASENLKKYNKVP